MVFGFRDYFNFLLYCMNVVSLEQAGYWSVTLGSPGCRSYYFRQCVIMRKRKSEGAHSSNRNALYPIVDVEIFGVMGFVQCWPCYKIC